MAAVYFQSPIAVYNVQKGIAIKCTGIVKRRDYTPSALPKILRGHNDTDIKKLNSEMPGWATWPMDSVQCKLGK